jgi:hypothetical protein
MDTDGTALPRGAYQTVNWQLARTEGVGAAWVEEHGRRRIGAVKGEVVADGLQLRRCGSASAVVVLVSFARCDVHRKSIRRQFRVRRASRMLSARAVLSRRSF